MNVEIHMSDGKAYFIRNQSNDDINRMAETLTKASHGVFRFKSTILSIAHIVRIDISD